MNVIQAPNWLQDRMAKLKTLPPPTLEKVKFQLKASKDFRNGRLSERGSSWCAKPMVP
jgi:hypothetical protein